MGVREEEKKASVAEAIPCLLWPQSPLLSTSIPCCWLRFQAYPILLFFFLLLFFNISYEFTFSNLIFIIYIFFPSFFFFHKLYIKKLFCFTKTCSPK